MQSLRADAGANDRDLAALALGQLNYGVTLRELSAAYTVFADAGVYHPWRSYYRVLDAEGRVLLSQPDRGEVVLSAGNAAIMTKLLQGVVEHGTSSAITLNKTVECAGKTGTTNADGDRWFVGYTPDLICGVWCGYEYPEPLEGRNLCTDIWNRVMGSIVKEQGGKKRFDVPSDVVKVSYCRDSGMLLDESCTADPRGNRAEIGWFLKGKEPQTHCTCHILVDYDGVDGGVSHGNCPEEHLKKAALIQVERRFPMQILVSDAQYVYGGDPAAMTPNNDPTEAYFEADGKRYRGVSYVEKPFHRSCTVHLTPPEGDWAYLIPKIFPDKE